jgi:hypothetical protein
LLVYISHGIINNPNWDIYSYLESIKIFWGNWILDISLNNPDFNDFARIFNPLPEFKDDEIKF